MKLRPTFLTALLLTGVAALAELVGSAAAMPLGKPPWLLSQTFRPRNLGAPTATTGGATRGGGTCLTEDHPLKALLPQISLGLTTSERPTFFWSIPAIPTQKASFLLLADDDTQVLYETNLTLPQTAGIISLQLPVTVAPLQVGKRYHWYLTLNCHPVNLKDNPVVEGWVERISPDAKLTQALAKASPQDQAVLYADAGIWHEALTTMANLRRGKPKDTQVTAGWTELLKSVGLATLAPVPLINCCTPDQTLSVDSTESLGESTR